MTDRDSSSLHVTAEGGKTVTAVRVHKWLELLHRDTGWLTDAWVNNIAAGLNADALTADQLCEVKLWTVGTTRARPAAIAVLLTSVDTRHGPLRWHTPDVNALGELHTPQDRFFYDEVSSGQGKRRGRPSDQERAEHQLRRAACLRELGEIESRRAIWRAFQAGMSQRQIGDLVGRSQPDVGRTIKKIDASPGLVEVTPREIAIRRATGEYSNAEMISRLLTFAYTLGEADPSPVGGGYLPGTWDQVRALRDEELISEAEWQEVFRAVKGVADTAQVVLPKDRQ